jgi:hypothetical protein
MPGDNPNNIRVSSSPGNRGVQFPEKEGLLWVGLQVVGLPFTPTTVRSATHGVFGVQVENGTASFQLL